MHMKSILVSVILSSTASASFGGLEARAAGEVLAKRQGAAADSLINDVTAALATCTGLTLAPTDISLLQGVPTPPVITESINLCDPTITGSEGAAFTSWITALSSWENDHSSFLSSWSSSVLSVCPDFTKVLSDVTGMGGAITATCTGSASKSSSTGTGAGSVTSTGTAKDSSTTGSSRSAPSAATTNGVPQQSIAAVAGAAIAAGMGLLAAL